jgi:hypothetical protein
MRWSVVPIDVIMGDCECLKSSEKNQLPLYKESLPMRGFFASLALLLFVRVAGATSVIPSDADFVRSLDGQWHFKLEQPGDEPEHGTMGGQPHPIVLPAHPEPFQTLDYKEDASWKRLAVPGNWEMAGFSAAPYNQPDNAIGLYRLDFVVPAAWQGRIVKINFDGVQNGAEVYLNGAPVDVDEPSEGRANFHQGGNTAFQVDLTPHVKFGQTNLLAFRSAATRTIRPSSYGPLATRTVKGTAIRSPSTRSARSTIRARG